MSVSRLLSADVVHRTVGENREVSNPRTWDVGGKSTLRTDFLSYTYILGSPPDVDAFLDRAVKRDIRIVRQETVDRFDLNKPIKARQVWTERTRDVKELRELGAYKRGIQVREADIILSRRLTIDEEIRPELNEANPSILALDFETDNVRGYVQATKDPIIAASIAWEDDGTEQSLVLSTRDRSEADLLRSLERMIRSISPDCIVTYNGNWFDWPYVLQRSELLGMKLHLGRDGTAVEWGHKEPRIAGRAALDLFRVIDRDYQELKDKRLKTVSDVLDLMKRKDRVLIEGRDIGKTWHGSNEDRERLLQYAADDAKATLRLAKLVLPSQYAMSKLLCVPLQDALHATRGHQVEFHMISNAHKRGMIYPNKQVVQNGGDDEQEGGAVMAPPTGLVDDSTIADVGGMYPTLIMAKNISPETFCDDAACTMQHHATPYIGTRTHYFEDQPGFVPTLVKDLVEARKPMKKELKNLTKGSAEHTRLDAEQDSYKRVAVSYYGCFRWTAFRYYDPRVTGAITAWARYYIMESIKIAREDYKIDVFYADTDSCFMRKNLRIMAFIEDVNKRFPVVFEVEDHFTRMFFNGAKKRYLALSTKHKSMEDCADKPCTRACQKIRGFESRRGDWSLASRQMQQAIIDAILFADTTEHGVAAALKVARSHIAHVARRQATVEDLLIRKKITMPRAQYKNRQAHVEAAYRALGDQVDELVDAQVEYVTVRGDAKEPLFKRTTLVNVLDSPDDIDVEWYVENQMAAAALRILEVFGVDYAMLRGQYKLEGFG